MANKYTFERAYGMTKRGLDRQIGWDIFCDGNWCSRWSTLRDAKAALAAEGLTGTVVR